MRPTWYGDVRTRNFCHEADIARTAIEDMHRTGLQRHMRIYIFGKAHNIDSRLDADHNIWIKIVNQKQSKACYKIMKSHESVSIIAKC
jgi:hypothetical protein